MLRFQETDAGFSFFNKEKTISIGIWENNCFIILYDDDIFTFSNAMQAFTFLNNKEFPSAAVVCNSQTQRLIDLINKRK